MRFVSKMIKSFAAINVETPGHVSQVHKLLYAPNYCMNSWALELEVYIKRNCALSAFDKLNNSLITAAYNYNTYFDPLPGLCYYL